MKSFEEALKLVLRHTPLLTPVSRDLLEASTFILAENVRAQENLPIFSNSAMDGFALRSIDAKSAHVFLKIKGTLKAGDSASVRVGKGESVRIMTGAPLPGGADAVVMKEDTEESEDQVWVKKPVKKGENIRLAGEDLRKGQFVLKRGARLNPANLGLLAAAGRRRGLVFRKPKVSLLLSGNELVLPGKRLGEGKIWESNSFALKAACAELGLDLIILGPVRDDPQDLKSGMAEGLKTSDVLLVSGGISVGDYDFVQDVLLGLKVNRIFWKVAIKPGKPLFFGIKGKKLVFGLPGNPVSALVVFLEFVRPALLKMMGENNVFLPEKIAVLEEGVTKKAGRLHFMKGIYQDRDGILSVRSAGLQHSHILRTTSSANCLAILEKDREEFKPGEKVKIQLFPWKT